MNMDKWMKLAIAYKSSWKLFRALRKMAEEPRFITNISILLHKVTKSLTKHCVVTKFTSSNCSNEFF